MGGGGTRPAAEEWLLFAEDGSAGSNNLSVFKASASSPIQVPIPQEGQTLSFNTLPLGEIHLANGKAFVVITSGLTGPAPDNLPSGGLAVVDVDDPDTLETTLVLASAATGRGSRIVHTFIDPEGKFLWAHNDGPSGDANPDSVFRVDVDPASPTYLTPSETVVGNGHKKAALGFPTTTQPTARMVYVVSSLTERRIDVIDRDPASGTFGQVIKIIRNVPASPHGMDYSPNSGRSFSGITGGGMVSVDGTLLDTANITNFPDVDCAPGGVPPASPGGTPYTGGIPVTDDNCVGSPATPGAGQEDPSVFVLSTGAGSNTTLIGGYVHVVTNDHDEDTVYTAGRSGAASMAWLTAVNPGSGSTPPGAGTDGVVAIELGDMAPSNFSVSHAAHKAYVPSSGGGTINDQVKVVDVDHDSATHNQVINTITVGTATGENRNIQASPDGRLVMAPNTSTNTVSVIDTETDTVIDTLTLTTGTTAGNVRLFKLPFDAEDNH
ncbi:MAG: hypothetical protein MPW15_26770 [Candidatus Manganitrophus sp.]|nr:hypothetical protein [Candidatus Manganitrophus sp.]